MCAAPIIEMTEVTKVYHGDVRALDRVTLAVKEGERCCLLGPNGAGKTTIMRLLQGSLEPTHGTLALFGSPAQGGALLRAKRRMGIVPQNPGFYPDLSVHEYLQFVHELYGSGDVGTTASNCGLDGFLDRPTTSLSGGYQRRLLVAAAIMHEPNLLLLDEPTVGLDPLAAADTRALLRRAMTGRTVLMSTHNLAEAEELCDTVIMVRQGTVLIHERIAELKGRIRPRVHLVARQDERHVGRVLDAIGVPWSPNGSGVWIHVSEPELAMPDVLRRALDRGLDVYECRTVSPNLEDLFVDVMKAA